MEISISSGLRSSDSILSLRYRVSAPLVSRVEIINTVFDTLLSFKVQVQVTWRHGSRFRVQDSRFLNVELKMIMNN
jgi:hypothetical protein